MKTLNVSEKTADSLRDFFDGEDIDLQTVSPGEKACVSIYPDEDGKRTECSPETLYEGGWITCTNARTLARRLNILMWESGKLLDFLHIKIRDCELGCFQ